MKNLNKKQIKEALHEITTHLKKCRVEDPEDYYRGWRECSDFVTKELNYLNEKIKTPNVQENKDYELMAKVALDMSNGIDPATQNVQIASKEEKE